MQEKKSFHHFEYHSLKIPTVDSTILSCTTTIHCGGIKCDYEILSLSGINVSNLNPGELVCCCVFLRKLGQERLREERNRETVILPIVAIFITVSLQNTTSKIISRRKAGDKG